MKKKKLICIGVCSPHSLSCFRDTKNKMVHRRECLEEALSRVALARVSLFDEGTLKSILESMGLIADEVLVGVTDQLLFQQKTFSSLLCGAKIKNPKKKAKKKQKKAKKNSSEAGFEPTPRFQDVISSHTILHRFFSSISLIKKKYVLDHSTIPTSLVFVRFSWFLQKENRQARKVSNFEKKWKK